MQLKEIEKRLLSGEDLIKVFGIRRMSYQVGKTTITEKQFNTVQTKYEGRFTIDYKFGGLTRHIYALKKD